VRLPGFANEIRLGEIGRIRMAGTPVMHVRIDGPQLGIGQGLKWRGSALARFDGKRWYNDPGPVEPIPIEGGHMQPVDRQQLWIHGPRISYEVQLKNVAGDVLFFAGVPESVGIEARSVVRTSVDGFQLPRGSARGIRYQVFRAYLPNDSRPARRMGVALTEADRARYLQLPEMDPRVAQLASSIAEGQLSRFSIARAIERRLRSDYPYSIEPPDQEPADPVAHFLFDRRKGHCEYFASAMAVMLRALSIPSRVATGFQSGTFNPMSGWTLIRSSDAHSWVEAFFDGVGWVTFDPTPPDPNYAATSVWSRAGLYLDAADVFWQEWVVNYDLARQLSLVDRLGRPHAAFGGWWAKWDVGGALPGWRGLGGGLALAAGAVAAWWMVPRMRRWRRRVERERVMRAGKGSASDATLLYERMLEALRRRGVEKPAWMTPAEFARCVSPQGNSSVDASAVEKVTEHYLALRYGGDSARAPELLRLVESLEQGA
jgi:transglutaminase-like putative cysteine protease